MSFSLVKDNQGINVSFRISTAFLIIVIIWFSCHKSSPVRAAHFLHRHITSFIHFITNAACLRPSLLFATNRAFSLIKPNIPVRLVWAWHSIFEVFPKREWLSHFESCTAANNQQRAFTPCLCFIVGLSTDCCSMYAKKGCAPQRRPEFKKFYQSADVSLFRASH